MSSAGRVIAGVGVAGLLLLAVLALQQRRGGDGHATDARAGDAGPRSPARVAARAIDPAGLDIPEEVAPGGDASGAKVPDTKVPDAKAPGSASRPLPREPTARQRELADTFYPLLKRWDERWVEQNFERSVRSEKLEEALDWLRPRLGECTEPVPFFVGSEHHARFLYPCEDGTLEAAFSTSKGDDGEKITRMLLGGRDVEPNPAVRRAAEGALRLIERWDPAAHDALFTDDFDTEKAEVFFSEVRDTRGLCTLGSVDLAQPQGALWFIDCERGPGLMKTSLNDDDEIRVFFIRDRRKIRPEP